MSALMQTGLLLCQSPVILDLLLPHLLVFLPPALGAQAVPRSVTIITASLFAKQVRLVHMYPSPLAHDVTTWRWGGGEEEKICVFAQV